MCETLSYVDFEKIKNAPPKWFMGYSDNTNFIFPLVTGCGVKAIYGSNISGFGKPWEKPEEDCLAVLEGRTNSVWGYEKIQMPEDGTEAKAANPLSPYILSEKKVLRFYPDENACAEFSGMLIGGCLDVLDNLVGTRFDFMKNFNDENKKIVWALEACDLSPMDIRRALWHMKEAGWFGNASGFVFGRPLAAWKGNYMGVDQYSAVTDVLADLGQPIVMDADFGHIAPDFPLVMGAWTKVAVESGNIGFSFDL